MLFRETVAAFDERGKSAQHFNVKSGGSYIYHFTLKG
jgi:hypothetical protein